MELHLKIAGIVMIALSFVHALFPRRFNWKNELGGLSLINRQMMNVHTLFIALMVLLMGVLCLTSSEELTKTVLGKKIALGLFIFWTVRLFVQFFGYSSKLWRGKRIETAIHILFSLLWLYLSSLFLYLYCINDGI